MIILLAEGSNNQLVLSREMASYISPRAGFTHHPLTLQAAAHMDDLVGRTIHYQSVDPVMTAAAPTLTTPYKSTPVFDEVSLPAGLRREHRTKVGAWGVIRVLEGRLRYQILDPASEAVLEPGRPGLFLPEQRHVVEPFGPVRMQVEFYDHFPDLKPSRFECRIHKRSAVSACRYVHLGGFDPRGPHQVEDVLPVIQKVIGDEPPMAAPPYCF